MGRALSIGGAGIWLMHFVAMLGFDVPASPVRYIEVENASFENGLLRINLGVVVALLIVRV